MPELRSSRNLGLEPTPAAVPSLDLAPWAWQPLPRAAMAPWWFGGSLVHSYSGGLLNKPYSNPIAIGIAMVIQFIGSFMMGQT